MSSPSPTPQPQPNPIGYRAPPRNLEAFQQLCQRVGVKPEWEAFEAEGLVPNATGFSARVTFRGRVVEDTSTHPSKRAARDAVAERAYATLNDMIAQANWSNMSGGWSGRGDGGWNGDGMGDGWGGSAGATAATNLGQENWIGALQEICQAMRWTLPNYEFFQNEAQFFCEATLEAFPDMVFGNRDRTPFIKKKDAQKNAARAAVQWIRNGSGNRRNGDGESTADDPTNRTDLPSYTEASRDGSAPTSPHAPRPGPSTARSWVSGISPSERATSAATSTSLNSQPLGGSGNATESYASQVQALCFKLKFQPPRYTFEPQPGGSSNYSRTYAVFDDYRLKGHHFEAKNIYGKKQAKEECARLVLAHLKEVEAEREAMARRVNESRAALSAGDSERSDL